MIAPVLSLQAVRRSFGGIEVLHGADLELRAGEVHALIGENGAGKSTTMKILGGYLPPSSGQVKLDGAPVRFAGHRGAEAAGVVMIHQEFNLAEPLSVEENIFLGRELRRGPFLDKRAMRAEARRLLAELDCPLDPCRRVADLSVSDKQMVEIAKALGREARVLIMDEPTAVLTRRETAVLLGLVARLRDRGTAILFTSHKLDEVAQVADRVTVLRDGAVVAAGPAADMTEDEMARAMVGRELSDLFPPKPPAPGAETVLSVEGLDVEGLAGPASFSLCRGEVLALAGLVGAGRTELMEGMMGLRAATGRIEVAGQALPRLSPGAARAAGIAYLTEDRKGRGLLLEKPLAENLTLLALGRFGRPFLDKAAEARALDEAIGLYDIRLRDRRMAAGQLSGGNQQKLLLAKVMLAEPQVVVIDEPTRGIDIGTKQQIYGLIAVLAASGRSVIVVSSELPEVIGLAHRVLVMRRGAIAGALEGGEIGEEAILRLAMGLDEGGRAA
ncbi:sugar ABC transporter ATP-binding protein [Mangrovicoccus sp. HB161399]|uniref:sugar ABC transporter ATP-binding protein n=1 Tax=Mangrovicoccus sp. HB161399 TaxID=2720392 RepID=UPI00155697D4|nr:sugar ABC transporter ATP-binding protein [Mangrovicoccus sp. HB161399]